MNPKPIKQNPIIAQRLLSIKDCFKYEFSFQYVPDKSSICSFFNNKPFAKHIVPKKLNTKPRKVK